MSGKYGKPVEAGSQMACSDGGRNHLLLQGHDIDPKVVCDVLQPVVIYIITTCH